jgi:N utilization substance protein B
MSNADGAMLRREQRERVLSLLYEAEQKEIAVSQVLDDLALPVESFVSEFVLGVDANRADAEALVAKHAEGWTLERMAVLDRIILTMGAYELAHRNDRPAAVVINEAIELAKQFGGSDEAGSFVNGVLNAIHASLNP